MNNNRETTPQQLSTTARSQQSTLSIRPVLGKRLVIAALSSALGIGFSQSATAADSERVGPLPAALACKTAAAPVPFSRLGDLATADSKGEGTGVEATPEGAYLHTDFQKISGNVTPEGLWLDSTEEGGGRLGVIASAVERIDFQLYSINSQRLPLSGSVIVSEETVTFTRPGLVEEYSVSVDGVRQDFIVTERPEGEGRLQIKLTLSGARAESAAAGAKLILNDSGRELAYSRLRVVDATDRELPATLEVLAHDRLAIRVDDSSAAYPVRIDPTFSDADWVGMMGQIPGASQPNAIICSGSDVYVGGSNYISKWDGAVWSDISSGWDVWISSLVLDNSGNLYAAGRFIQDSNDPNINNICYAVAKWNGLEWTFFGADGDEGVYALAFDGSGNLYAGGHFTTIGGIAANGIAKWNGSTWSAMGSGIEGSTNSKISPHIAVLEFDGSGNIYAGGHFTTMDGVAAHCIAKWNGSTWSGINSAIVGPLTSGGRLDPSIKALALDNTGNLYVGGLFISIDSIAASNIAKWNGSAWSSLGSGADSGDVRSLAFDSFGNLYAGGGFFHMGGISVGYIAKWNGTTWSGIQSGWPDDAVDAIAFDSSGNLYAGGDFGFVGDLAAHGIAKWNGTNWAVLGSGMDGQVFALALDGSGNLYAGGSFWIVEGKVVNHIAKWNGSSWSALGYGLHGMGYDVGRVTALAVDASGNLYAGGEFQRTGDDMPMKYISKWNGTTWSALDSGLNGPVYALAFDSSGNLYAGGDFTRAGDEDTGIEVSCIAKWNGTTWSAMDSGLSGPVYALTFDRSGNLYAGGRFKDPGAGNANSIAKWNGITWSALGSGITYTISGEIYTAAVHSISIDIADILYAGGAFNRAGDVAADNIAKWNGTTWSALPSGTGSPSGLPVRSLATDDQGNLYVAGEFYYHAARITKWNGSAWSKMGSGVDFDAYALAMDHRYGRLYVGGSFATAGGHNSPKIAKAIVGTGTQPRPRIVVEQPYEMRLIGGGSKTFGLVDLGSNTSLTFTIKNTGSANLTGLAITKHGTHAADFTVGALGATTLASGASTTFTVTFAPSAAGSRSAAIQIASNDPDENPFDISLSGSGAVVIPLPEALDQPTLTFVNSGTLPWSGQTATTHDNVDAAKSGVITHSQTSEMSTSLNGPGTVSFWWKVSSESGYDYLRFYIDGFEQTGKISGTVDWTQKSYDLSAGSHTLKWSYSKDSSSSSGSDCGWVDQVTFVPAALAPEIAVEQPTGTNLADGGFTSFGTVAVGGNAALTFTIKNTGNANLTGLAITKDGANAGDFTVGSLGAATVAAGASTTFTVAFAPGGTGTRTAAIHIASNDADENPFDITLTGSGATTSAFSYEVISGFITITGYTGPGGVVAVPSNLDGLSVTAIGTSSFYNKNTITSVTIPASVNSIGDYAFGYCSALSICSIPNSVTSIGSNAFVYCTGLTSMTIPNSVTSIGFGLFSGCIGLASISVDAANPNYSSMDGILFNKSQTSLIQFPGGKSGTYIIPDSVTSIGDYAFHSCASLLSVTIPYSVTSIGVGVFRPCARLGSISVAVANPNYSSLDGVLFNKARNTLIQCPGGKSGTCIIPNTVSSIGAFSFYYCTGLTSMSIPASVTSIADSAFRYCTGLTSMSIPGGVNSIGSSAFSHCTGLTSALFAANAPTMGSSVFASTAAGFKVYFLAGAAGFTIPTWQGYPTVGVANGSIVTQPVSTSITSGATATLTVTAIGTGPLTYQWYQGASGVTTNPVGTNSANFTTPALTTATSYWVKVTNTANPTGAFSNTATVSIGTPQETWRQTYFSTTANTGTAADLADPDKDGVVNLLEYAFGLHPLQPSAGQVPKLQHSGNNLTCTFTQPTGVSGITYGAEWSPTMAAGSWQPVTDTGTAPQHTFTVPMTGSLQKFVRLKVTTP